MMSVPTVPVYRLDRVIEQRLKAALDGGAAEVRVAPSPDRQRVITAYYDRCAHVITRGYESAAFDRLAQEIVAEFAAMKRRARR